jgi:flagellar M-ring protein FliF
VWLIAGSVVTLAVIAGFTVMMGKPEYKPLLTGMEPAEAQQIAQRLAAKNIPYEVSTDGKTVSVPADKLDSSRLEIASEGMPKSGRLGFEIFDKLNWGQTDFDEKVNYQRALEGELERTIQTLSGVESARVHLVLPSDSLFLDRQSQAKASVALKMRSRGGLSQGMQTSIARLVSGAVEKLNAEDVIVVDADTNRPFSMPQQGTLVASNEAGVELANRIISTLEPVVGADHVRASVNVEYDPTTTEENRETYDPNGVVAVSTQRSEEQMMGSALGGVPGTSSNVPNSKGAAKQTATPSGQSSKTENNMYAVNKVVRRTMEPAGRIRRISAALLLDDSVEAQQGNGSPVRRKRSPEELKQIEELAKAAIGLDTNRGDTIAIQNLSFAQLNTAPEKVTPVERVQRILREWSVAVRYGAMLLLFVLVYFLLLRPVKKQVITAVRGPAALPQKSEPAAEEVAAVPAAPQIPELPDLPPPTLTEEKQRTLQLKKDLTEKIKAEPVSASRLVKAWLQEEE